jgi:hypothetical protein
MTSTPHHQVRLFTATLAGLALAIATAAPATGSTITTTDHTGERSAAAAFVASATGLPYPDHWVRYGSRALTGASMEAFVASNTGYG